ncbi:MAG TPA: ROK family protein [Tepidisphaeraceae bacterium]|nr:ROK family protein [Tepidisphaeraceae bacterium]
MNRAIGIDIGGTKISLGLVNHTGHILAQLKLPTNPDQGFDPAIQRISDAIGDLLQQTHTTLANVAGIGIGCPGPLNPFTGVILNDFTLPSWGGHNLIQALHNRFGIPVHLENDADAALLGEAFAGAGRGASNLVMLTFGTGVGGAALSQGTVYRGAHGEHPEIGHLPIDPTGPACYCGLNGCLESIASGTGIGNLGKAAGFTDAQDVFTSALANNDLARSIVDRAIAAATTALWTLIHTFLPERVILGGGIMERHYSLFEPSLQRVISQATLRPSTGMQLCQAQLQNDAGLVGAAFLALRETLRK